MILRTPVEQEEQGEIALQFLRDEEIFFYVFVAVFSELCCNFRMRKQETNLVGGAFYRVRQQSSVLVDDLRGDAANR